MKKLLAVMMALLLTGCVSVAKVETGERVVGERMQVSIEGAWNHISYPGSGPAEIWTMEGTAVDQLLLFSGIKDGQAIHSTVGGGDKKNFEFRSTMQPDEIAALFEGTLTRDGSRYRLVKLEPMMFSGQNGFRFEYTLVRKIDSVQLSGVGYAAVSRGELFAIVYMAPRLVFYPRQIARVEQVGKSMRIKP